MPEGTPEPPPEAGDGLEVTRIELPYEGGSIAVADGAVWSVPHMNPKALRIDARTGEITDEIDLPAVGAEIAAGSEMVWASVAQPPDFEPMALVRIDPKRRRVVAQVNAPAVFPEIAGGRVFAAGQDGRLYVIDPDTNRVAKRIRTGREGFVYAVAGRHAWIARPGELKQVDVQSGRVRDFSRLVRGLPEGYDGVEELTPTLAANGLMWAVGARSLVGLDPATGEVRARIAGPKKSTMLPDAVVHGGDIWLFAFGEEDAIMRLVRVDPARRRVVRRFTIDTFPESGFGAGPAALWVPEAARPSLLRVTPPR